jgi:hypothetical protein
LIHCVRFLVRRGIVELGAREQAATERRTSSRVASHIDRPSRASFYLTNPSLSWPNGAVLRITGGGSEIRCAAFARDALMYPLWRKACKGSSGRPLDLRHSCTIGRVSCQKALRRVSSASTSEHFSCRTARRWWSTNAARVRFLAPCTPFVSSPDLPFKLWLWSTIKAMSTGTFSIHTF